jgi:hypothetical protein
VVGLLELQASLPAMDDLLARRFPGSQELAALCDETIERSAGLIAAAQADGSLRADFGPADLAGLFLANAGILRSPAKTDDGTWRRHMDFVLDGLRTESAGRG